MKNLHLTRLTGPVTLCCILVAALFLSPGNALADKPTKDNKKPKRIALETQQYETLEFGHIVADTKGKGRIIIDAETGEKIVSHGVFDVGGFHSPAKYLVTGEPYARFKIQLPGTGRLKGQNTGAIAKLQSLKSFPKHHGRLGADGKAWITVGGELKLNDPTIADHYKGQFDIDVTYQDSRKQHND